MTLGVEGWTVRTCGVNVGRKGCCCCCCAKAVCGAVVAERIARRVKNALIGQRDAHEA
jgi:hypothetical protein